MIEINKKVGYRLVTKAGQKGVINLAKAVPLVGGPIGAAESARMSMIHPTGTSRSSARP